MKFRIQALPMSSACWNQRNLRRIISLAYNQGIFRNEHTNQCFVTALQQTKSSVHELPGINENSFKMDRTFANIKTSLTRNQQWNRVNLLLAPPQQQQQQRNFTTMMLKTSHKAITESAMVPSNAGASAIFKLYTARPLLLEKRLKRPTLLVVPFRRNYKNVVAWKMHNGMIYIETLISLDDFVIAYTEQCSLFKIFCHERTFAARRR
jgi:hypothetical protein